MIVLHIETCWEPPEAHWSCRQSVTAHQCKLRDYDTETVQVPLVYRQGRHLVWAVRVACNSSGTQTDARQSAVPAQPSWVLHPGHSCPLVCQQHNISSGSKCRTHFIPLYTTNILSFCLVHVHYLQVAKLPNMSQACLLHACFDAALQLQGSSECQRYSLGMIWS